MTTVVVVKKAGQVVMAADTMVTFGDTRLPHRFEANSKIFKVNGPDGKGCKFTIKPRPRHKYFSVA